MGSAAAAATASSAGKRWTESNKLVAPEVETSHPRAPQERHSTAGFLVETGRRFVEMYGVFPRSAGRKRGRVH